MLTQEYLKSILYYDQSSGDFTWLISSSRYEIGQVAGKLTNYGYWRIYINGKAYQAHRLAWFNMTGEWPPRDIDHKNTIRDDNSWDNLRLATEIENGYNRGFQRNNKLKIKGVSFEKRSGKFAAYIKLNKIHKNLGLFDTAEEAKRAYDNEARNQGEFVHSSVSKSAC